MQRRVSPSLAFLVLIVAMTSPALRLVCEEPRSEDSGGLQLVLHETRRSPLDLEVAGDIAGLPEGTARFITREELLRARQVSALVTDDANFREPTEVSGVLLETLVQQLGAAPQADLVVAICDDKYRTNYTRAYVAAHDPILVLNIKGKPPDGWPKDPENHKLSMGPYLISHAKFTPGYKILSHADEPQIPWGVVRLEFRDEEKVFGSIAPRGPHAKDVDVQAGYHIAEQNCFRCHNMGDEGGQKAGRSWQVLGTWAAASPGYFSGYIRDPKSKNAKSQMPGFLEYDTATLKALTDYFRTFGPQEKQ